jgi:addiction module HigA family antidote
MMKELKMSDLDLPAIHPGEILRALYLEPLGMSYHELSEKIHVRRTRMRQIVSEKTALDLQTALRLSHFFKTNPDFWISLQTSFELKSRSKRQ